MFCCFFDHYSSRQVGFEKIDDISVYTPKKLTQVEDLPLCLLQSLFHFSFVNGYRTQVDRASSEGH
jgi:hypothetical protein